MTRYILTIMLLFCTAFCFAQTNTDTTGMSPLKGVTYAQYKAYTDGVDLNNMALVAQANHYPDPQKALDWKKDLQLSAQQVADITAINTELQRKLKEMGGFIIKNEMAIDDLFRTKKATDGNIIFYTNRYGLYQGEMRNAILQAYIKLQSILTLSQRLKYAGLQKIHH